MGDERQDGGRHILPLSLDENSGGQNQKNVVRETRHFSNPTLKSHEEYDPSSGSVVQNGCQDLNLKNLSVPTTSLKPLNDAKGSPRENTSCATLPLASDRSERPSM